MENKPASEAIVELGIAALDLAEFDDAIERFSEAAVEDSNNARAWFYLGLCYLETREAELAIEALNRAINAAPKYADAHYLLGTARGATGEFEQAAACYRRALEIEPNHHKAGEFLLRTEALIASREHYRAALKLIYPGDAAVRPPDWLNRAARELLHSAAIFTDSPAKSELPRLANEIIESGRRVPVVGQDGASGLDDVARPFREIEGPFWASAILKAEQAFQRKNWPEAAASYYEALDLSPDHAFIHHTLGVIYFALGDVESGVKAWQRALDLEPDLDFTALGTLGE